MMDWLRCWLKGHDWKDMSTRVPGMKMCQRCGLWQ